MTWFGSVGQGLESSWWGAGSNYLQRAHCRTRT